MDFNYLLTKQVDGILLITINREDKMNALNIDLLEELDLVMDEVYDNDKILGAIITGSGSKAFVAGADIAEFAEYGVEEGSDMSQFGNEVFFGIEQCIKPVIAAVNGYALGGGCELAMACHMRIASSNARFGQPEVNLGVIPGYGGTQRLIQLVGKGKALEMMMTGEPIVADEALRFGLVNHVVEPDQLMEKSISIMKLITSKAPLALEGIIECVNDHFNPDADGFETEIELFGECFGTEDFKEGTQAFLNKRKPKFKGK